MSSGPPPGKRPNVLVVYGVLQHPLRTWYRDHLYAFERHAKARCFYLNVAVSKAPRWLKEIDFDAILFHNTLTGQRMSPPILNFQLKRAREIKDLAPTKIAMIQDECIYSDLMGEFINDFGVGHVFSVAPPTEWQKIYAGIDHDKVEFHECLTGYLEDETVARIDQIVAEQDSGPGLRSTDIGYRAWAGLPSFGRHGLLRMQVAEEVGREADERGLTTDMSTKLADTHHGDDWYRFLARCRYVIGAEGGATVLDPRGEFRVKAERYVAQHPGASFDEIEAACFPGEDGKLKLFAISPRQIEACATRTCQVLIEGGYSGVLTPGRHYIELKKDFSNLTEVMDSLADEEQRKRITDTAYEEIVASRAYSYEAFVSQLETATGLAGTEPRQDYDPEIERLHKRAVRADKRSWAKVALAVRGARAARSTADTILPKKLMGRIRERFAAGEDGVDSVHPVGNAENRPKS